MSDVATSPRHPDVDPDLVRGLKPLGGKPRLRDYVASLWRRREFARSLASGALQGQHMDTVLGNLWQLINPILLIAIYYLVFGVLLGAAVEGTDFRPANYVGFLTIGVFVYSYSQRSLTNGAGAIVSNLGLIRSLQFPRAILPLSSVIKETLGFGASVAVMLAVMVATGEGITWGWLMLPVVLAVQAAFNLGGALITARLTDSVRDFRNLLPFVFRLLFYVSGILYDITRFTDERPSLQAVDELFLLNPFYVFVSLAREYLMTSHAHFAPGLLWLSALAWTVALLVGGLWWFVGAEKSYGRG